MTAKVPRFSYPKLYVSLETALTWIYPILGPLPLLHDVGGDQPEEAHGGRKQSLPGAGRPTGQGRQQTLRGHPLASSLAHY